jgi:hypothetical protein
MGNTAEDFDLKMRLHAEANLNMVRNWVGMTGHPGFYDAADKYGIMLMDDFWYANPWDGPNATDEPLFYSASEKKVKRVRSHASVVLYCGRNEGKPSLTMEPRLKAMTANGTGTVDPTRWYVSDSAGPADGTDGHGPYGQRDAVWYFDNTPAASGYNSNGNGAKNLSSERGMLNIPTSESMHRMLGQDIVWPHISGGLGGTTLNDIQTNAAANVWGQHDFTTGGATEAGQQVRHLYRSYDPDIMNRGVEAYITTSQLTNYDNHRSLFESVYVNDTPGLMQWMSQSSWPSMAWQTYDWYYDLSGGYYGEKMGNQPINPILDIRDQTVFLSNETLDDLVDVTVKAEVFTISGVKAGEVSTVTSLEAGGRSSEFYQTGGPTTLYVRQGPALLTLPDIPGLSGVRFVRTSVVASNGKELAYNFYWTNPDVTAVWAQGSRTSRGTNTPTTWSDYKAIRTTLKGTDDAPVAPVPVDVEVLAGVSPEPGWAGLTVKLTNRGSLPALQAHVNGVDEDGVQILPFIADDNYVTLMPGESRTLTVKYELAGRAGDVTLVGLDGFNVVAASSPIWASDADLAALDTALGVYGLFEAQQSRWTPETFGPFHAAMDAARAARAAVPPVADDVRAALAAVKAAGDVLVEGVDVSTLAALVARAESVLADPSGYVSAYLAELGSALQAARAVLAAPGLTQDQVLQGSIALAGALAKVAPKGDKTGLRALIGLARGLDSARYTPGSWAPVAAALAAAGPVEADAEASVDQVDAAYQALSSALNGLVLKAAKAGLKSAADLAAAILANQSAYVAASLAGLAEAKAAADSVYADDDATVAQVTEAQTALIVKIGGVRLKLNAPAAAAGGLLSPAQAALAAARPAGVAAAVAGVKAFAKAARPVVKGKARVGSKLKAKAGAWSPKPELSYQWYAGGKKIAKATKASYKVKAADKGKKLSVKITAAKTGYTTLVKASAKTKRVK